MYSQREREHRRIIDQRHEKLSHGLGVLEREVDKCRILFYDLPASWEKEYNAKRMKDEGESMWLSFKSMYASG